jgi:hypothetical protein
LFVNHAHVNGESMAEILKERMARCLERKNRAVRGLEREITGVQGRIERARREVRMLDVAFRINPFKFS